MLIWARPAIIEKLQRELAEPVASERQVVYILVELRKLLQQEAYERERQGQPKSYEFYALDFYCDWAVHARLDQAGAQRIVERIDAWQQLLETVLDQESGKPIKGDFHKVFTEIDKTIQLKNFRTQLSSFLKKCDLDTTLADDDQKWVEFLRHYFSVIEDCPLVCESRGLKCVDQITVCRVETSAVVNPKYTLHVQWQWKSKQTGTSVHHESNF